MRTVGILTAFLASLLLLACSTQGGQGDLNPYSSGESNVSPDAARNPEPGGGGGVSSGNDSMNPM